MTKRMISLVLLLRLLSGVCGGAQAAGPAWAQKVRTFAEVLMQTARESNENAVISPVSAYLALAMAGAGARGETEAAFGLALGLPADERAAAAREMAVLLSGEGNGFSLRLANSIWIDEDITVQPSFLDGTARDFAAEAFHLDLQERTALGSVNGWVNDKTSGRIPRLLDNIDPTAVMLLINALTMDAAWEDEFDPISTRQGDFTRGDGSVVQANYMYNGLDTRRYFHKDGMEGVLLPYADGKTGFLAVRPDNGDIGSFTLSGDKLAGWLSALKPTKNVAVKLPKFEKDFMMVMNDALCAMGLADAFSPNTADFSGIGKGKAGNLFIGRVLQKVLMRVNEKGTEAAAATVVEVLAGSAPIKDPIFVEFVTPFVYAVVNLETGLPIFLGQMDDPS